MVQHLVKQKQNRLKNYGNNMAQPWSKVESSKEYLTLAPEEQQAAKEEYFSSVISKKPEFQKLSDEDKMSAQLEFMGEQQPVKKSVDSESLKRAAILGGVGAAAVGAGAWMGKPAFDILGYRNQANTIKQQLGLNRSIPIEELPTQISGKGKIATEPLRATAKDVGVQSKINLTKSKNMLDTFKSSVLNNNIEETAQLIKAGHPEMLNSGYNAYGDMLNRATDLMEKQTTGGIGATGFRDNVVTKVKDAYGEFIKDTDLAELTKLEKRLSKGNINLKTAKGMIDNVDVTSRVKASLRNNFGDFIEAIAPHGSEALAEIKAGNAWYKPFAEMNNATYKIIDKKTGIMDDTKLVKWLSDYVGKEKDISKSNILKLMSEGTVGGQGVKPIKGLSGKLNTLDEVRVMKEALIENIQRTKDLGLVSKNLADKKVLAEVTKYEKLLLKANELKGLTKQAKFRLASRLAVGGALTGGKAAHLIGRALGIFGVAPQLLQAGSYASEFEKWRQAQEFGERGFLTQDLLGGAEYVSPDDTEAMIRRGLVG
jgi:hypothetical protein